MTVLWSRLEGKLILSFCLSKIHTDWVFKQCLSWFNFIAASRRLWTHAHRHYKIGWYWWNETQKDCIASLMIKWQSPQVCPVRTITDANVPMRSDLLHTHEVKTWSGWWMMPVNIIIPCKGTYIHIWIRELTDIIRVWTVKW